MEAIVDGCPADRARDNRVLDTFVTSGKAESWTEVRGGQPESRRRAERRGRNGGTSWNKAPSPTNRSKHHTFAPVPPNSQEFRFRPRRDAGASVLQPRGRDRRPRCGRPVPRSMFVSLRRAHAGDETRVEPRTQESRGDGSGPPRRSPAARQRRGRRAILPRGPPATATAPRGRTDPSVTPERYYFRPIAVSNGLPSLLPPQSLRLHDGPETRPPNLLPVPGPAALPAGETAGRGDPVLPNARQVSAGPTVRSDERRWI